MGYSINDSIVVSDRIRENQKLLRHLPYAELVNRSINQTLSRTVMTSLTTLLPILALLFLGGSVLRDFALAIFVGIFVGTYSSIYVVSAWWSSGSRCKSNGARRPLKAPARPRELTARGGGRAPPGPFGAGEAPPRRRACL